MNIIYISSECFPFAKAGSLADIVSKLAKDIEKQGHNVKIFIPRYGLIDPASYQIERLPTDFHVKFNGNDVLASVYKGILPNSLAGIFFIESQHHFSNSKEIYLTETQNEERFKFFSHACLKVISKLGFNPDIIHIFNSHTSEISYHKNASLVLTLNNISDIKGNILKRLRDSINNCDLITTGSDGFKNELLVGTHKTGLEDVLMNKKERFCSILIPPDEDVYNPETDKLITQNYSKSYFSIGKKKCKENLLEFLNLENNLQIPLFSTIGCFKYDKGVDVLIETLHQLADLNMQFVVLGKGEPIYEQELTKIGAKYKNIKVCIGYDYEFSKKVYAASDFFISTARYNSTGSALLNAMKYGSIPIAYATGAVKEIVIDYNQNSEYGNGFAYNQLTKEDLMESITNALKVYKNKEKWPSLVRQAMSSDVTKLNSVSKYITCYEEILSLPANVCQ